MLEAWLNRHWYSPSAPPYLRPIEWLYRAVIALRRRSYSPGSRRIQVPDVAVGNLTVGGTGKTPLVIALARALQSRGVRVGVISRGYGAAVREPALLSARSDPAIHGDEPVLIARATEAPVVVSPDRVAATALLAKRGMQLVISDDGLQHYRLGRALEIAVVDGARGFGNGHLLPAGPLREPVSRLAEVDWLVFNGEPSPSTIAALERVAKHRDRLQMRLAATQARTVSGDRPARELASFRGAPVHAVAGIGNPARFFATLREAGLQLIEHPFPDHHPFTAAESS
jgi:tetraacyldisaccharide 4'-kinase